MFDGCREFDIDVEDGIAPARHLLPPCTAHEESQRPESGAQPREGLGDQADPRKEVLDGFPTQYISAP